MFLHEYFPEKCFYPVYGLDMYNLIYNSNLVLNSPKYNKKHNKIPQDTFELLYQYYVLHLFYTISTINLDVLVVPESEAEIKALEQDGVI